MRAVIQRVDQATLHADGALRAEIRRGLVVLLGVESGDEQADLRYIADKIANLRIFEDENGKMNRSALDVGGQILLVPNFTIAGDCRKGRRPSFDNAMKPTQAAEMFEAVAAAIRQAGVTVELGVFGAHMHVTLTNNGPVTLILDSRTR